MKTLLKRSMTVLLITAILVLGLIQAGIVYADDSDAGVGALLDSLKNAAASAELPNGKEIYNLLLIGVDRQDDSWNGNSDCMLLVSVNKTSQTVHLMSFMRDLGVEVPGYGTNKLNYACAVGGPDLVVETIEQNFGVDIDAYAWTDFTSMAEVIDDLGGLTLEISDAEAERMGLSEGGTVDCNGDQVVLYARIRAVGNNDYERTERQRTVLLKIKEKLEGLSTADAAAFFAKALQVVKHNLSAADLLQLTTLLPSMLDYEFVTSRVPYDGMYTGSGEMLMPTQPDTNDAIAAELER